MRLKNPQASTVEKSGVKPIFSKTGAINSTIAAESAIEIVK